ncbi:hypothetical protein [Aestuariimicrobium sp. Y1814]|uniref:hypothetical protein n=1 Tax=Aestuariimicrobium sp. Y1814 TaxID=3418742 RepID=UPI003DA6FE6C
MNGVLTSLWEEVSPLELGSLECYSNNPRQSHDWVARCWEVVVEPTLDGHCATDIALARLDAHALVEVHNEVVRRLDPNRAWQPRPGRVEGLDDLPDLVVGYLAAEYRLTPCAGGRQERDSLLEGILYGRTRRLVRHRSDFLEAQVPLIAEAAGVGFADRTARGEDLLRRFR